MKDLELETALTKELCFICCKEVSGPLIMNSVLTKKHAEKVKELHGKVIGFTEKPCEECEELLNKAFIFISYDENKSNLDDLPGGFFRTGHIIGTKKEIPLVQEFVKKHAPTALEKGYIFMPDNIMRDLGLINE